MSIVITEKDNKYWLHRVSHTPINFTPYTNPSAIEDFCYYMKIGEIVDLCGLEINQEYPDLDCYDDFEVVDRKLQIPHYDRIYDEISYRLKEKPAKNSYVTQEINPDDFSTTNIITTKITNGMLHECYCFYPEHVAQEIKTTLLECMSRHIDNIIINNASISEKKYLTEELSQIQIKQVLSKEQLQEKVDEVKEYIIEHNTDITTSFIEEVIYKSNIPKESVPEFYILMLTMVKELEKITTLAGMAFQAQFLIEKLIVNLNNK